MASRKSRNWVNVRYQLRRQSRRTFFLLYKQRGKLPEENSYEISGSFLSRLFHGFLDTRIFMYLIFITARLTFDLSAHIREYARWVKSTIEIYVEIIEEDNMDESVCEWTVFIALRFARETTRRSREMSVLFFFVGYFLILFLYYCRRAI